MSERHPEPDLEYLKRVLLEMLAIPSPTGFTDTIVRYVAERLDELGIPFELTRRGTIRATLKGRQTSPDRAVSAHSIPSAPACANCRTAGWPWRRLAAGPAASPRAAGSACSPTPACSAAVSCR